MMKDTFATDLEKRSPLRTVEAIANYCRLHKLHVAVAESCTGGLIGAKVTEQAGISDVFSGGVISYANEVKRDVLGVPEKLLVTVGAVSPEVACAMASGVCNRLGCEVGVSVTGIAGPGGGSAQKPVGTVYVGVKVPRREAFAEGFHFDPEWERNQIREASAKAALALLAKTLLEGGAQ